MNKNRGSYSRFQLGSALFMIAALLWLSVSAPFVNASREQNDQNSASVSAPFAGTEEEAPNPLGGTEEKNSKSSSSSFSEEYLHDHHISEYFISVSSLFHKLENASTYVAYHGELLVPPPNVA